MSRLAVGEPRRPARMTEREALEKGYTVDRHCYPWVAYKGPRFQPTEWHTIKTPAT
jgi:hypothetical protein